MFSAIPRPPGKHFPSGGAALVAALSNDRPFVWILLLIDELPGHLQGAARMKGRRAVLRGALDFCTVSLVAQDALQGAEAGFEDFLNPLYLIDVLNVPEVTLWDFIRTRDVGPSPLVRSLLPAPPLSL